MDNIIHSVREINERGWRERGLRKWLGEKKQIQRENVHDFDLRLRSDAQIYCKSVVIKLRDGAHHWGFRATADRAWIKRGVLSHF